MIDGLETYAEYREWGLPWLSTITSAWQTVRNAEISAGIQALDQEADGPLQKISLMLYSRLFAVVWKWLNTGPDLPTFVH